MARTIVYQVKEIIRERLDVFENQKIKEEDILSDLDHAGSLDILWIDLDLKFGLPFIGNDVIDHERHDKIVHKIATVGDVIKYVKKYRKNDIPRASVSQVRRDVTRIVRAQYPIPRGQVREDTDLTPRYDSTTLEKVLSSLECLYAIEKFPYDTNLLEQRGRVRTVGDLTAYIAQNKTV